MKQFVIGSIVLLLMTLGWGECGVGEQIPAPRGGNCESWIPTP